MGCGPVAADREHCVQPGSSQQRDVVEDQLRRNYVEIREGLASFANANSLNVETARGRETIESEFILVACGTRPARREDIPSAHPHALDADPPFPATHAQELPPSAIALGAGVRGLGAAASLAAPGLRVC